MTQLLLDSDDGATMQDFDKFDFDAAFTSVEQHEDYLVDLAATSVCDDYSYKYAYQESQK